MGHLQKILEQETNTFFFHYWWYLKDLFPDVDIDAL